MIAPEELPAIDALVESFVDVDPINLVGLRATVLGVIHDAMKLERQALRGVLMDRVARHQRMRESSMAKAEELIRAGGANVEGWVNLAGRCQSLRRECEFIMHLLEERDHGPEAGADELSPL